VVKPTIVISFPLMVFPQLLSSTILESLSYAVFTMLRFRVASSICSLGSLFTLLELDFLLQPSFKVAYHQLKQFLTKLELNNHKVSSFLTL
jgi:hypothetical protein